MKHLKSINESDSDDLIIDTIKDILIHLNDEKFEIYVYPDFEYKYDSIKIEITKEKLQLKPTYYTIDECRSYINHVINYLNAEKFYEYSIYIWPTTSTSKTEITESFDDFNGITKCIEIDFYRDNTKKIKIRKSGKI